jgi:hypothetical protein
MDLLRHNFTATQCYFGSKKRFLFGVPAKTMLPKEPKARQTFCSPCASLPPFPSPRSTPKPKSYKTAILERPGQASFCVPASSTGLPPSMFLAARLRPASRLALPIIRSYTPSSLSLAEVIIQCPTMGDSITEGTIIEWSKNIGERVEEGDVVALIETDKVSSGRAAGAEGGRVTVLVSLCPRCVCVLLCVVCCLHRHPLLCLLRPASLTRPLTRPRTHPPIPHSPNAR